MSLVVPNDSEVTMLRRMLNVNQTNTVLLRLYDNDLTPDPTTGLANITETTHTGYTAATLVNNAWVVATDAGGSATASYAEQTFTFSGAATGVDVFGYYVTDSAGVLLWVERFSSSPYAIPSAGGQIAITATISLENI